MEELKEVGAALLKLNKIKISKGFLEERLASHPDYPSLISLTDTLDEMGIEYLALEVEKDKIGELNYPILIHVSEGKDQGFFIIKSLDEFKNKHAELLNYWQGITLMVERGSIPKRSSQDAYQKKELSQRLPLFSLLIFLGLALLVFMTLNFHPFPLFITGTALIGIVVCILIIQYTLGISNSFTQKLCDSKSESGCEKILNSKQSKLFGDFGFGDFGLIYFLTQFIFSFSSWINQTIPSSLPILTGIGSLAFLFTIYSVYYQKFIAKSWCKLCLMVCGILWLQAFVLAWEAFPLSAEVFNFSIPQIPLFSGLLILTGLIWLNLMPLFKQRKEALRDKIALEKWKRNTNIFLTLLNNQNQADTSPWLGDVFAGNPQASLQLLVVCNPYCGPCAVRHKELEELLQARKDELGLTVRFTLNSKDKTDNRTIAVQHLLQAHQYQIKKGLSPLKPLDDWFEWMNLETWLKTWGHTKTEFIDESLLEQNENWCNQSDIRYTPTLFFNGFEFPKEFEVNDLQGMIPTLLESIAQQTPAREEVLEV